MVTYWSQKSFLQPSFIAKYSEIFKNVVKTNVERIYWDVETFSRKFYGILTHPIYTIYTTYVLLHTNVFMVEVVEEAMQLNKPITPAERSIPQLEK